MADVARVVKVEPAVEHDLHQGGEAAGQIVGRRGVVGAGERVQKLTGLADGLRWIDPGEDDAFRPLNAAQMGGERVGQSVAGVPQKEGVIRGRDACAGRRQVVWKRWHGRAGPSLRSRLILVADRAVVE